MKVEAVMTWDVSVCTPEESLASAAWKMWERDIGSLPVTDSDGRVIAMITDRDIAMAALFSGKPLAERQVKDAMSQRLATIRPNDETGALEDLMCLEQVHRVPVVSPLGRLRGIVTLNDSAHHRGYPFGERGATSEGVAEALAAISASRCHRVKPSLRLSA